MANRTAEEKPSRESQHGGDGREQTRATEPRVQQTERRRRLRRGWAAIAAGMLLIGLGIGIGAATRSEVVAWILVLPGFFVLLIGGRPKRASSAGRSGADSAP